MPDGDQAARGHEFPARHAHASDNLAWLQDRLRQRVAEVAGLKGERSFGPTSVPELLTAIGISGLGSGLD